MHQIYFMAYPKTDVRRIRRRRECYQLREVGGYEEGERKESRERKDERLFKLCAIPTFLGGPEALNGVPSSQGKAQ